MIKFIKNNFCILILPICFIIGLIRERQIEAYQASINRPTMTGQFTLFSYIFVGICLTSITLLLDFIYRSKYSEIRKLVSYVIVLLIGLMLVFLSLLLLH
jgi:hypothetical protein